MKVTFEFPKVGRKRLVGAACLCTVASVLWIYGASRRSAPAVLPLHILVGVALPLAVAWVTLLLMERRIRRELVRVDRRPMPERVKAGVR